MSAGSISRHEVYNDIIHLALAEDNVPAVLVFTVVSWANRKRPDSMTCILWSTGQALAWDTTSGAVLPPKHKQEVAHFL